nr:MAG TPA: hypothetical protein [Caudoviricetes sp.]
MGVSVVLEYRKTLGLDVINRVNGFLHSIRMLKMKYNEEYYSTELSR